MKTLLTAILALSLVACQSVPNYATGEGCWRYGISETDNTGRMRNTDAATVKVVKLNYDDLLKACDQQDNRTLAGYWMDKRTMVLRACYQPIENVIYSYNLNWGDDNYYEAHERCHIIWGREHNACWHQGYAQWGDSVADACEWNSDTTTGQ